MSNIEKSIVEVSRVILKLNGSIGHYVYDLEFYKNDLYFTIGNDVRRVKHEAIEKLVKENKERVECNSELLLTGSHGQPCLKIDRSRNLMFIGFIDTQHNSSLGQIIQIFDLKQPAINKNFFVSVGEIRFPKLRPSTEVDTSRIVLRQIILEERFKRAIFEIRTPYASSGNKCKICYLDNYLDPKKNTVEGLWECKEPLYTLRFLKTKPNLFAAGGGIYHGEDFTLKIFDISKPGNPILETKKLHSRPIRALETFVHPVLNEEFVITGSSSGDIIVWNLKGENIARGKSTEMVSSLLMVNSTLFLHFGSWGCVESVDLMKLGENNGKFDLKEVCSKSITGSTTHVGRSVWNFGTGANMKRFASIQGDSTVRIHELVGGAKRELEKDWTVMDEMVENDRIERFQFLIDPENIREVFFAEGVWMKIVGLEDMNIPKILFRL